MAIELQPVFYVPLWKISISDWEEKKEKLMALPMWDEEEYIFDNHFSDYEKNTVNPDNSYRDLFCTILQSELVEFADTLQVSQLQVKEVWAQKYNNKQWMAPHNHGGLGFSAVLYAEMFGEHEATTFIAPFNNFIDGSVIRHQPDVEEGDLIIFPSALQHYATPNETYSSRTIFSFNCYGIK